VIKKTQNVNELRQYLSHALSTDELSKFVSWLEGWHIQTSLILLESSKGTNN